MAKGVLIHNPSSRYDDRPERHYHFPKMYLSRVEPLVGDWILYYESGKRGGAMAYRAMARLAALRPDPERADHFYVDVEPGSYLVFAQDVPLRGEDGTIVNPFLDAGEGRISSGRAVSAVQPIDEATFWTIVGRGLETHDLPRADEPGLAEEGAAYVLDRPWVEVTRAERDRVFRRRVLAAYEATCAFTGLGFRNGGGRAEVQAAHIRPVAQGGADIVSNGLALSGTVHWMFDRGLLGLADDGAILVSRQVNDVAGTDRLLLPGRRARLAEGAGLRPHPEYLAWHREAVFKR